MFDDLDDEMNGYLTAIAGTHFAADLDRILASPTALPTLVAIANIPKESAAANSLSARRACEGEGEAQRLTETFRRTCVACVRRVATLAEPGKLRDVAPMVVGAFLVGACERLRAD